MLSIKSNSLILAIISIFIFSYGVQARGYSILAIDGGGIRGIIPSVAIIKMEKWAYDYMVKNNDTKKYTW